MRVSCAAPKGLCSPTLPIQLQEMGLQVIETEQIIRAVYEGEDHAIGTALVKLFTFEVDHDIVVDFCDEQDQHPKKTKKSRRNRK